jgi:hypothetical protein
MQKVKTISSESHPSDRLRLASERMERALKRMELAIQKQSQIKIAANKNLEDEISAVRARYKALSDVTQTVAHKLEDTMSRLRKVAE